MARSLLNPRGAIQERPPVFSVTPETAVSNSAYGPQTKQPRADQSPSDDFSALVDSNAAAASDSRPAPEAPLPPRRDQRDARRTDAPAANNDAAPREASSASNDDSAPARQDTASSTPAESGKNDDKSPGKVKAAGNKKSGDEKTQDAEAGADTTAPATSSPGTDAVAAVIAIVAAPATTSDGASEAPAAIAASAAAKAAAAIAAAASPTAPQTDPSQAKTPAATQITEAGVPAELIAATPADGAATDDTAAKLIAAAGAAGSAKGKTEAASAKNPETAAIKDSKDGKQPADTSVSATATDRTVKPETLASDADGKPVQHDKTTASDTEASGHAAKTAPQGEHRAAAPTPAFQPDPALPSSAVMPQQPVQTHAANLTAIPVAPTQTAFAADTPVPLNGLAADIALRAAGGNSRFEIRLDPAELGRIDVRLDVDKHGNVTSHLTVERPATLDMLRNDAPKLQQALEDAGLKTGDSGLQFSLRDQSSSGQNNDSGTGRQSQRVIIADEDTVPAQIAGRSYGRMLGSSGGIDIRI